MIEDIKSDKYKGLKYVIVYMFDRFARNANGTFCDGYLIYGYKIRKEPIAGMDKE